MASTTSTATSNEEIAPKDVPNEVAKLERMPRPFGAAHVAEAAFEGFWSDDASIAIPGTEDEWASALVRYKAALKLCRDSRKELGEDDDTYKTILARAAVERNALWALTRADKQLELTEAAITVRLRYVQVADRGLEWLQRRADDLSLRKAAFSDQGRALEAARARLRTEIGTDAQEAEEAALEGAFSNSGLCEGPGR